MANQFEIYAGGNIYFQSYNTVIAKVDSKDKTTLQDGYWDNYSATTNKYLNQFLGTDGIVDIRKRVRDGEYAVANL